MFGSGILISGPAFLALVHDSTSYNRRGVAISIVQFILVASFAFLPLIFSQMMPAYDLEDFMQLSMIVALGAGLIWFFSVWREERPGTSKPMEDEGFQKAFSGILADKRTRRYALFLGASAFFVFMQDAVLEPFGGWTANLATVRPLLVLFGIGFGIFTVGGVSLLMAMSVEAQAAAYLALWSVIQLVSRGAGIAAGGLLRDAALAVTGSFASTYGLVFWLEALGALSCIWLLRRADVPGFALTTGRTEVIEPIGVAAD
jgi:BCD family chlorophyll transporter-like MFS transporter